MTNLRFFKKFLRNSLALALIIFGQALSIHDKNWKPCGLQGEMISPTMLAAKEGKTNLLRSMGLQEINEQSANGMTALHYAIGFNQEEAASFLIKNGANLILLDKWDNSPLSMSRKRNQKKIIDEIETALNDGRHIGLNDKSADKHFIILVASYNNESWLEKNLESLLNQKYKKFTIIYMNDQSTDQTLKGAQLFAQKHRAGNKVIFVDNKVKRYCLGNYLFAVERFCPKKSILVLVDGDDWLNDTNVLSSLNDLYQNPDVWLTYGNSIMYPQNITTPFCKPIEPSLLQKKMLRHVCKKNLNWPVHHLRTFYTSLFKKINYADMLDENGKLFMYAEDVAYMLPMLEMAGPSHIKFISRDWYVYNMKNPLITSRRFGTSAIHQAFKFICDKKNYETIKTLA